MRVGRVSQSDRHDNGKQRYSKGLQHRFFLPFSHGEKATKRGGLVCNTFVPHSFSEGGKTYSKQTTVRSTLT
jgi:hypothetical protein